MSGEERSPMRDECMRTVGAVAVQDERRRRINDALEGAVILARGLRGNPIE